MKPQTLTAVATLAFVATVASHSIQAQQAPLLKLDYGAQTECEFQTTGGVVIDGDTPGVITAQGSFAASGCPTGGGATPTAAVNLTATPASIDPGDSATISWSATADICRYNGSTLPAAVAGWPASGDACIGAVECALGNSITPTFNTAGTYNFQLTCTSGASGQQPRTTAVKIAPIEVTGTPPTGNCVAPAGLTRQMLGSISTHAGSQLKNNVDVSRWDRVLGWAFSSTLQHYSWPGSIPNSPKVYMDNHKYWALQFTVPQNYPLYNPGTQSPYGSFSTADTDVTEGVSWALSISEDCGDFIAPPQSDPDYYCYTEATTLALGLGWLVTNPGNEISGICNLERGKTYYLNIVAGQLNNPAASTCPGAQCKFNIFYSGSADGTYGPIP